MRIVAGGIALFGLTAFGQVGIFSSRSTNMTDDTIRVTLGAPRMMGPLSVVLGAPYSADQVFEHTHTLADGTHITQNRTAQHMARDSQGRTRVEQPLMPGMGRMGPGSNESSTVNEPMLIEIQDPVAGYAYALDAQNKVAHRFAIPPAVERPRQPVQRAAGSGGGGGGSGSVRAGAAASGPAMRPEMGAPEDLGTQTIEGVLAQGTRRVTTWPIGSQGNDRPLTTTSETWRSRELQLTVLSKSASLLNGDSVTKLTNISRAEPDPGLFQAPASFTVVDEKDSFTMILKRE